MGEHNQVEALAVVGAGHPQWAGHYQRGGGAEDTVFRFQILIKRWRHLNLEAARNRRKKSRLPLHPPGRNSRSLKERPANGGAANKDSFTSLTWPSLIKRR